MALLLFFPFWQSLYEIDRFCSQIYEWNDIAIPFPLRSLWFFLSSLLKYAKLAHLPLALALSHNWTLWRHVSSPAYCCHLSSEENEAQIVNIFSHMPFKAIHFKTCINLVKDLSPVSRLKLKVRNVNVFTQYGLKVPKNIHSLVQLLLAQRS